MSDEDTSHLSSLSDGAGCTEIWEHLSEQRAAAEAEAEAEAEADAEDDETAEQTAEESTDEADQKDAAGVPCP